MPQLSAQVLERFQTDGYVATDGLLALDEIETFGSAIDRAVKHRTAGDDRTLAEKSSYEQSFVQCMRLWETDADVTPLTFHPRLAQAAAELLGVERVRIWQDQALYKEPAGRITDPHQDATFWPIGEAPLVSAWIPLDGSTLEGGAVGYVPGSHKLGPLKTVNLLETSDAYKILSDPALSDPALSDPALSDPALSNPALGNNKLTYVEAEKGTVVWHHGMTVHAALANRSPATRRAFTIVYIADDQRRVKPWPNFPLDRAGVEVGEIIKGDGLPLAWPQPDSYPDPPAVIGQPTGPQVPGSQVRRGTR